jgi:DNA-binding IclR family transcriptional regulator
VLDLTELLAASRQPRGVSDIARALGTSKARIYRHLRALVERGYVRQEPETERYEIGVKLLILGEAVRDRFDILGAMRPVMSELREVTGLTVTAATLVEGAVTVIELQQGAALVEFGIRPGATLDFHASAHGLVALAFGPPELTDAVLERPLRALTPRTMIRSEEVRAAAEKARKQGWATAADQMLIGVNTLAAPVFDHRGAFRGSIAIVGSTQFIPARPAKAQIDQVVRAAAEASRRLGWTEALAAPAD